MLTCPRLLSDTWLFAEDSSKIASDIGEGTARTWQLIDGREAGVDKHAVQRIRGECHGCSDDESQHIGVVVVRRAPPTSDVARADLSCNYLASPLECLL